MPYEITLNIEFFVAAFPCAFERLIARMYQHMRTQSARSCELFPALCANICLPISFTLYNCGWTIVMTLSVAYMLFSTFLGMRTWSIITCVTMMQRWMIVRVCRSNGRPYHIIIRSNCNSTLAKHRTCTCGLMIDLRSNMHRISAQGMNMASWNSIHLKSHSWNDITSPPRFALRTEWQAI